MATHFLTIEHFSFLPPPLALLGRFAAIWLVALGLTVLTSIGTYLAIEKPGIRLGNHLIRSYAVEHRLTARVS